MAKKKEQIIITLEEELTKIISETNGINLSDTLELLGYSEVVLENPPVQKTLNEFITLLAAFQVDEVDINTLLGHPMAEVIFNFFQKFPLPYHEEHIHLTGSLSAEFIYPRLKKLLEGKDRAIYEKQIQAVYGEDSIPIESVEDVDDLIRLKDGEQFGTYLKILFLAKLILTSREAHFDAAYHMAKELYEKYNVGNIRLKFTLSRANKMDAEQIPGLENVTEEDVVIGLYEGFKKFQSEVDCFDFTLSPSFRKELNFFDSDSYSTKKEHFEAQVNSLLEIMDKYPHIRKYLKEIDTVGDEKELYRKAHFKELKGGLRKLQYHGMKIRSHHGETWKNLRKGIQSVDNAMNIWHIDTLEHGLSLGINPNYYFHRLYQRVMDKNLKHQQILKKSLEWEELEDMEWHDPEIKEKLYEGIPLNDEEKISFLKTKFHTAREVEHYQHDILNRMIHKNVSLVALPSSNLKLTGAFPDYKDHPFSWWEKKGLRLGVGTDNYITLSTNFIQEMLILLFSDPGKLKITKLLMITAKEDRRPYISHLLWTMRKKIESKNTSEE
ncbi:adenosine/AMP deaminase [Bacteriovorax sp. Seq25_V]|uniref:adenosine/AMP deaminase n=1 Tax=Bacteriovorax sp. Seq25_V TaxID=1201288 RepID=UPI00038A2E9F|nr:adenosine/AMP deaminase [Bacteriovorax sp. Seq25_V]EQC45475.1 adenosine/AMP deaminase domain protein [Bacteriovorax sp. Seq25_V]